MVKNILRLVCLASLSLSAYAQSDAQKVSSEVISEEYESDFLTAGFHKSKRDQLRSMMPKNSCAVFFANPIRNRSNDVNFEYHQDPNFYYLTGLQEPNSVLIIFSEPVWIHGEETIEIIYVQERDPGKEVWDGSRLGTQGAEDKLKIQTVRSNADFPKNKLKLNKFDVITYTGNTENLKDNPFAKNDLHDLQESFQKKLDDNDKDNVQKGLYSGWLAELRQVKTEEELVLMRRAIDITCEAQKELMKALKPGMKEYQTEAVVEFVFKLNGAEYPGFPSIQGSGVNSCVLHYQTNRKQMTGKNLLVSDVGAEYHGYTADVTRTLPVDGEYSEEEKTIYELVFEAQEEGIKAAQVGNDFWSTNVATTTVISQGLMDLGIIKSPIEIRKYFMHGTSHYLGLDVHDVGTYGNFEENMVITVEPGIYIPEGSPCDKKWWNIGIRIEDDILITSEGPVNLSACVPRTIPEIEALMQENSFLEE